ncbi:lactamase [Candidatus Shapirobacteria bacterium CG03_land_8_20_14_0_80_39_12]|uniref:Lactamase n=1 Tax=Candidatus Shapirobacteria bacterium CG03_land_8_20_14_0_80_39_12 TaxID=1974879 RepID=A0A2M7BCP6_9BACT|nr:MAG: lactamase [Candidatus Shapirobacteria bacterium CG03_land_8_20_14_0_80_39_12]
MILLNPNMDITYLGHSSFKIKTKTATVVTDPFSPEMVGFKFPKAEADMVTVSHPHKDHDFVAGITGDPLVISQPGEYEAKGISFFGFPALHGGKTEAEKIANTIFLIEADGLSICHLGDLGEMPSPKIMEEIIGADILMVPVGGTYTFGPKEAVEIVHHIEPSIVLPMHFKAPNLPELSGLEEFLDEMGVEKAEKLDKLSVVKDKLPEETKVVVLERKA